MSTHSTTPATADRPVPGTRTRDLVPVANGGRHGVPPTLNPNRYYQGDPPTVTHFIAP